MKQKKLTFEKFTVAKLTNMTQIYGGSGDQGETQTETKTTLPTTMITSMATEGN